MTYLSTPLCTLTSAMPAEDVAGVLAADHDQIAVLFAAADQLLRDPARTGEARALIPSLIAAVATHVKAETRVVYAACAERGVADLRDLAHEGVRDHDALQRAMRTVGDLLSASDDQLAAGLRIAKTLFDRHRETEEDELFTTMDVAFGRDERAALAAAVEAEKARLRKELGHVPPPRRQPERRAAYVR
jgi:hypothetical protein